MYLKRLDIKNFRSIKDASISFNKGVNILIGENNSGKTAILDALRIAFSYGKQVRDIYVSLSDFHIDKNNPDAEVEDIEFSLFFEIQKDEEAGIYLDFLSVKDKGKRELQLHFRYYIEERKGISRVRYNVWGGDNEGQKITPEVLDLIYVVYLGALRDAVHYLRPVRGNKLGELFSNLVTDKKEQDNLAKKIRSVLNDDEEWKSIINEGEEKVNKHLSETSIGSKEQDLEIDFLPFEFRRIVDNLRVQIPVFSKNILSEKVEQQYFELYQNGLGYNNLIYFATVLGDLKRKKELEDEAYVSLLIEEPEAHLHPQLQNTFFNYLNKLNEIGIQIFITSHSPTITAKANLDSLILLQEQENKISSISINNTSLDEPNRKYLSKFLDVTKSQLFFSKGVILVEGISEALLMPVFSKILGDKFDIEKHGIEVVNICGVAFEHFGKLFNSKTSSNRLACRCAILTDDDRNQDDEISSRAKNAQNLKGGNLQVMLANKTFEFELFKTSNNKDILLNIFCEMHPNAAKKIKEGSSINEHAENFLEKVNSNKAKSELAHRLAIELETNSLSREGFSVPEYIEKAIRWVIKGEKNV